MRDLEATLRGAVRAPLRARLSRRSWARRTRRPQPEAAALQETEVRASQGAWVSAQNRSSWVWYWFFFGRNFRIT